MSPKVFPVHWEWIISIRLIPPGSWLATLIWTSHTYQNHSSEVKKVQYGFRGFKHYCPHPHWDKSQGGSGWGCCWCIWCPKCRRQVQGRTILQWLSHCVAAISALPLLTLHLNPVPRKLIHFSTLKFIGTSQDMMVKCRVVLYNLWWTTSQKNPVSIFEGMMTSSNWGFVGT